MKATTNPMIYWTLLVHESWRLYMAATLKGPAPVDEPFPQQGLAK